MKRHYLAVAVLAFALGMTACSSGNKETTAAPTTTAAQTETEKSAEAEDDMELEYFYGFVGEVADKVVTVKDDAGREVKFDVSEAEIEGADAIGEGDEIEVAYAGELSSDTTKAKSVDIVTSAAAEAAEEAAAEEDAMDSEDAKINTLSGKVAEVGADYVVIDTVDPENTLFTFLGKEGMFDKLKIGDTATIIYKGTLTDKTITATGVK